ncbi:MAG: triose-phosphate isomerase [Acidiferrobacterales bacterium]|nr:triose-phosphate isomerase [Acidiferrobacterales bacterium]
MRTPVIAGNWKMNGSVEMARSLCGDLIEGLRTAGDNASRIEVLLCPPATLLGQVSRAIADSQIRCGSQDIDERESGAFTGQISASMVIDAGGTHTLVGHSERRTLFGETDEVVARKTSAALRANLTPVVCIGETREEREAEQTNAVVGRQISAIVRHCGADVFRNAIIAYEPVWAIGTGLTATPEQAQETHRFIRQLLAAEDSAIAEGCRILYGGSMKPDNAPDLLAQTDIDGGLIGGASLNSKDFFAICAAAIEQAA